MSGSEGDRGGRGNAGGGSGIAAGGSRIAGGTGPRDPSGGAVLETALPLPLLHRGKVRDVYDAGPGLLLMVASDRVSAFDVVMPDPIPRKGEVLTLITAWWLGQVEDLTPHHLLSVRAEEIEEAVPALREVPREGWARRSMLVRRTAPVLVECVVRGYISGSAWKEYRTEGTLAGEPLPPGLRESDRLAAPIFSPATKAQEGHDENIPFEAVVAEVGSGLAERLRELSLAIYGRGVEVAARHGILLADTKFEFGHDAAGRLLLIDEVLTPDSSRFWPSEHYAPGRGQPSLDKQPIRDHLASLPDWNGNPPGPRLPPEVIEATTARYQEIFRRLTGFSLDAYPLPHFAPTGAGEPIPVKEAPAPGVAAGGSIAGVGTPPEPGGP